MNGMAVDNGAWNESTWAVSPEIVEWWKGISTVCIIIYWSTRRSRLVHSIFRIVFYELKTKWHSHFALPWHCRCSYLLLSLLLPTLLSSDIQRYNRKRRPITDIDRWHLEIEIVVKWTICQSVERINYYEIAPGVEITFQIYFIAGHRERCRWRSTGIRGEQSV